MSQIFSSKVWERASVSGSDLLVLLALAEMANDNGVCSPTVRTIAKMVRLSERQTKRILANLERDGFIQRVRRITKDGDYTSSLYRLNI